MRDYDVIRSKRKTISIQITREGKLVVRAPSRMSSSRISDFVKSHEAWISKNIASMSDELARKRSFSFTDGQSVYFLGCPLIIRTGSYINAVQINDNELLVSDKIPENSREKAIVGFLKGQAAFYLEKRVESFARQMGVSPKGLSVTSAKTRWGSCSGKNRINFSFRLISAPPEIIDYVVVHELAHILEHNHSPGFYAHIARILPDYKLRVKNMKEFQKLMTF